MPEFFGVFGVFDAIVQRYSEVHKDIDDDRCIDALMHIETLSRQVVTYIYIFQVHNQVHNQVHMYVLYIHNRQVSECIITLPDAVGRLSSTPVIIAFSYCLSPKPLCRVSSPPRPRGDQAATALFSN